MSAVEDYMHGAVEVRASSSMSDGGQLDITNVLLVQKNQLNANVALYISPRFRIDTKVSINVIEGEMCR